jgi:hypothetical protein
MTLGVGLQQSVDMGHVGRHIVRVIYVHILYVSNA